MSGRAAPAARRGVGAQGSPASNGVVSIRAHTSYRPDYSMLASNRVTAARQKLGLTRAEFAGYLTDALGWPVYEPAVKRWEAGKAPPGDALLACTAVTHDDFSLTAPLLTAAPAAFPVEALAGPWVTCYQFSHDGEAKFHADIARVTIGPDGRVQAVNHPPEPRSEGRGRSFRNVISGHLSGRHLIGEWVNTSDTRYYGALMLAVLPGETVMEGPYSGVKSDVEVSTGLWRWVRIDPDEGLAEITLREPSDLYDLVMSHSQYGAPLTLADVRGEP
jgi:DNA-binding transcriptional regulator YiaG